ncbi:MAG: hypothetical protein BroJett011_42460 [Chloroflexota bacterium]|nr:MAG: hypothetical protein BroJett011_42460 [Chloroflexota bacterium]
MIDPSDLEPFRAFEIEAPFLDPLLPVKIRFVPLRRTQKNPAYRVKAITVRLNGEERQATAADISLVTGRDFFQTETDQIGWERLILWLSHLLNDEEAATLGSNHEIEYLKWVGERAAEIHRKRDDNDLKGLNARRSVKPAKPGPIGPCTIGFAGGRKPTHQTLATCRFR